MGGEAAEGGSEIARAVVIEAGFGIVAPAVEEVRISRAAGHGGNAKVSVIDGVDHRPVRIRHPHHVEEVILQVKIVLAIAGHHQDFVDVVAIHIRGQRGSGAVAFLDLAVAGIVEARLRYYPVKVSIIDRIIVYERRIGLMAGKIIFFFDINAY